MLANGKGQGEMAKKVLNGTNVKDIPIAREVTNKYMFDYNVLKKYNLSISYGFSNYESGSNLEIIELIKEADDEMYKFKREIKKHNE